MCYYLLLFHFSILYSHLINNTQKHYKIITQYLIIVSTKSKCLFKMVIFKNSFISSKYQIEYKIKQNKYAVMNLIKYTLQY